MALTSWSSLATVVKDKVQDVLLFVKGVGVNEIYALEVDPTTGALPVTVITPAISGSVPSDRIFLNMGSTNVTSSAYVQIIASTSAATNGAYIANTGSQPLIIAVGAAASEVDTIYIPPYLESTLFSFKIAISTRLSVKSLSQTSVRGYIAIDLY